MAGHTTDQCSDYDWLEPLGNGSFGEVSKVRKRIDERMRLDSRSERSFEKPRHLMSGAKRSW